MCGIVGYIGKKNAVEVGVDGLRALQYRGYDSAGVAVFSKNGIREKKSVGQVEVLEKVVREIKRVYFLADSDSKKN